MRDYAKQFAEKMNYQKIRMEDRDDFVDWINDNLELTQFSDKQDAIDMFDNLAAKNEAIIINNSGFFAAIKDATTPQLGIIFEPIATPLPIEPNQEDCQEDCFNATDACLDGVDGVYNAMQQYVDVPVIGGAVAAIAEFTYQVGYNGCTYDLNMCLSNCPQ